MLARKAALARRNRDAAPAAYHRALAFALLAAPLLALTPAAKLVFGSLFLHMGTGGTAPVVDPGPVLLAWAEPSLVAPSRAALLPFGRVLDAVGRLWLGVFALGVLQLTWTRMRLRRRLRAAVPAPEAVRVQALEVAQRLGVRPPAIQVSPEVATPFATGFLAPVVGLDPHSCTLGPVALGYALEHELLHIARGDTAGRIAVSGRLAPDVIRAVMRNELGRFRECYETLPQPRPVAMSKLIFTIGTAGNVTAGRVDSEASPVLGQCLERVMLAIRFPAPEAGDVTVSYPVQFGP